MNSCFSIEHFLYDSDVQVEKGIWLIIISIGWRRIDANSSPFLIAHVRKMMDESDVNLIKKSIERQKLVMKQAWKKAKEELGVEQLGKMLHMKFGYPTQIAVSLRAEALFDKYCLKNMSWHVHLVILRLK